MNHKLYSEGSFNNKIILNDFIKINPLVLNHLNVYIMTH